MENLAPQPTIEACQLTDEQLVEQGFIYTVGMKPAFASTPVGMASDPNIRAVFDRNFAPERQARVARYVGDAMPGQVVDLLTNNLFHVDHRRGMLNADSLASCSNQGEIPSHLARLEHYARVGGATPAGSLLYASEKGMPSIELTKVTLLGTAWQAARNAVASGMAAFSGTSGEWKSNGAIDKGPKLGLAAYGENGEILAVTVRARKDRGTAGGRWQVREMQSYIVRVDADSGIDPEITQALQLFAGPERTLAFTQALVQQINEASAHGDVSGLKKAAYVVFGNRSEAAVNRIVKAAATVSAFERVVHGEIERDTLELRDWAIPVTQTIYAHDLWAPKSADVASKEKAEDQEIRDRLQLMVAEADARYNETKTQDWQAHVSYMTGAVALAGAS